MDTKIEKIDISKAVKGGRTPYVFSKKSGPDWLQVDWQGKITGTRPSTETAATTAVIKVTDKDNTVQTFTVTVGAVTKPKGVEVSGTITSYGSKTDTITVQLIEAGLTEPAYEAIVTGNSAAYSFETVPTGEYTLKVMKKGHAPWTEEIAVDGSAVTKDVTIYLIGDVNRDGKIDANDMQRIYAHISGENLLH